MSPRGIRWLVVISLTVVLGWPLSGGGYDWNALFIGVGVAFLLSYGGYVVIERFIAMRRRVLYDRGVELGDERKARRRRRNKS